MPKSTGAVSSAGTRVSQLFSDAVINGVLICDALLDTGSAYSMVSFALYDRLPTCPAINTLENSALDIVGVGGASAEVIGFVEVPLLIAGFEVVDPMLVVSELPFAMLIGMDVLRPHAASFSVCYSTSLQLCNSVCPVCLERQNETKRESRNAHAVMCAVDANRMPMLLLRSPPVSLSAPMFAPLAYLMFEAMFSSVSDPIPVTIFQALPASRPSRILWNSTSRHPLFLLFRRPFCSSRRFLRRRPSRRLRRSPCCRLRRSSRYLYS